MKKERLPRMTRIARIYADQAKALKWLLRESQQTALCSPFMKSCIPASARSAQIRAIRVIRGKKKLLDLSA